MGTRALNEEQMLIDEDDFDALILSKISDIIHALFKVYRQNFMAAFDQIAPHFVQLLVTLKTLIKV